MSNLPGRIFREAWIAGVTKHYPGEPKPGYIAPWEEMPEWERQAASTVYEQVQTLMGVSNRGASKLTPEQKGRFVSICWIAQIYRHFAQPKESYVLDWTEQPAWQQQTNIDIFAAIEAHVSAS